MCVVVLKNMLKIRSLPLSDNGNATGCVLIDGGWCEGHGNRSCCVVGKGCGNGGGIISTR